MGLSALSSSSQDVARCRKAASERYRGAVEDFLQKAAVKGGQHLLLLDKTLGLAKMGSVDEFVTEDQLRNSSLKNICLEDVSLQTELITNHM